MTTTTNTTTVTAVIRESVKNSIDAARTSMDAAMRRQKRVLLTSGATPSTAETKQR